MHDTINKELYKTLNLLCVEDDEDILNTYRELFSIFFKNVYTASNGIEGLNTFKSNSIDIILTDHMMPDMTGIEMSKKIRALDATVPIILVTAMDNNELLQNALEVNVTSFLKKPFNQETLFNTFATSVKSVIADRVMLRQQKLVIDYSRYQENKSFDKEKQIIKDESEIDIENKKYKFCIYYKPLDILSGDSYIVKRVNDGCDFIFLIDGMGKGISASITAMLSSAFMNYYVTDKIQKDEYINLKDLTLEFFKYIQPNLLEDEVVSANILMLNHKEDKLYYATFSMPAMLYKLNGQKTQTIPSNNPPLSPYTKNVNISSIDLTNLERMLIYTDGLNENTINKERQTYADFLIEDFNTSQDQKDFINRFNNRISKQEDDITYIYIKKHGNSL